MNDLRKRLHWATVALGWWIVLSPLLLFPYGYWSVIGGRFCWFFLIVNGIAFETFREDILERKVDDDMCRFLSRVAPLPDSVDPYVVCDLFRLPLHCVVGGGVGVVCVIFAYISYLENNVKIRE